MFPSLERRIKAIEDNCHGAAPTVLFVQMVAHPNQPDAEPQAALIGNGTLQRNEGETAIAFSERAMAQARASMPKGARLPVVLMGPLDHLI